MKTIERKTMLYKTGVEYGDYTINHVQGCAHGCKFPCYAMMMAKRFGKAKTYEEWCEPKLVSNALEILDKEIPKLKVTTVGNISDAIAPINVPTFHDAYPININPKKYLIELCFLSVVKTANDSSVTPKAATYFIPFPLSILLNTHILIIICLKFNIKVAITIAIILEVSATIPAAIIWLAPANTVRDIRHVWNTENPACLAIIAYAIPTGIKPNITGRPAFNPFIKSLFFILFSYLKFALKTLNTFS